MRALERLVRSCAFSPVRASALIPRALWLWCIIVNVSTEVRARFFERRARFFIDVVQYVASSALSVVGVVWELAAKRAPRDTSAGSAGDTRDSVR